MAFQNVRRILRIGSILSSYKLILVAGTSSRPKYRSLLLKLLRPFIHHGEISIRYRCYGSFYKTFLRISDLSADFLSTRELCVNDIYRLDRTFRPDCVIDGGGNIGLFTLRAAASIAPPGTGSTRFLICEPLPRNIEQIQKHLSVNGVQAEVLPICLGAVRQSIPFFCRGANESSFDPHLPFESVMEVPVVPLMDVVGSNNEERILIKLDIEGMEVETLAAYIPTERRAVYVVGELHNYPRNAPLMKRLFEEHGWRLELFDIDTETCSFRGCSPLAVPLLDWTRCAEAEPPRAFRNN
jgi:FkbM family methyltransferase